MERYFHTVKRADFGKNIEGKAHCHHGMTDGRIALIPSDAPLDIFFYGESEHHIDTAWFVPVRVVFGAISMSPWDILVAVFLFMSPPYPIVHFVFAFQVLAFVSSPRFQSLFTRWGE